MDLQKLTCTILSFLFFPLLAFTLHNITDKRQCSWIDIRGHTGSNSNTRPLNPHWNLRGPRPHPGCFRISTYVLLTSELASLKTAGCVKKALDIEEFKFSYFAEDAVAAGPSLTNCEVLNPGFPHIFKNRFPYFFNSFWILIFKKLNTITSLHFSKFLIMKLKSTHCIKLHK